MKQMISKFIYKIKNIVPDKKPTSTRRGKRCLTHCSHCGDFVPQDSKLTFHDSKTQDIDTLMFSLKNEEKMHCYTQIVNYSKATNELNINQFCRSCGAEFQNCLILKVLDIVVILFI